MTTQLIRSKLFVPASRPELFTKALGTAADAISIDLEDAVQESRKAEAREAVSAFLQSPSAAAEDKVVIVRINGLDTVHFRADVEHCAWPGLDILNLPKAESPEDVRTVSALLDHLEKERGLAKPIGILINIESPRGLRNAAAIAAADPRIVGLQLGFADLLEPLGIDRANHAAIEHLQLDVRLAAGESGLPAYDSAYGNIKDAAGFRREAVASFALGFEGKTCIHPSQIAIANDVYRPSDEQIADAMEVAAAWQDAQHKGLGVITVKGRMIDAPFARRAEAIATLARRLDIHPTGKEASE